MDTGTKRSGSAWLAGLALFALSAAAQAGRTSVSEDTGFRGADRHVNGDIAELVSSGFASRRSRADRSGRVVLYSQPNLRGKALAVSGEVEDLAGSGFNDAAESLVVNSGTWTMCRDAHFRGDCREFGPGRYNLNTMGFDHAISSLRPSDDRDARRAGRDRPGRGRGIELFSEPNLRGQRVGFNRDVDDFADGSGFNDSAESLVVHSGTWELCSDARFGGNCVVFRPGNYPSLGDMTKRFSSARRVR